MNIKDRTEKEISNAVMFAFGNALYVTKRLSKDPMSYFYYGNFTYDETSCEDGKDCFIHYSGSKLVVDNMSGSGEFNKERLERTREMFEELIGIIKNIECFLEKNRKTGG